MRSEAAHAIFLKLPVAGNVKTRLGKTIGMEKAAEIYKKLAEKNIFDCISNKYDTFFCIEPYSELNHFKNWLGTDNKFINQCGFDLGDRMINCFYEIFEFGYDKCIISGSDIIGLSAKIIEPAFIELESADCVIGPAEDGGYYMLGFKSSSFEISLFKNMEWSTDKVYNESISRLLKSGRTYAATLILPDIDTEDDLKKIPWENNV